MYVCMYVCMYVHICMYVCMYVGMYVCMYVHICMYVCMYTYVCMYVCIYALFLLCASCSADHNFLNLIYTHQKTTVSVCIIYIPVTSRAFNAEARFRRQICGRKRGTETIPSSSISISPVHIIPPLHLIVICRRRYTVFATDSIFKNSHLKKYVPFIESSIILRFETALEVKPKTKL